LIAITKAIAENVIYRPCVLYVHVSYLSSKMAQTFYTAENLGMPFRYIRELSMIVAPSGNRVVSRGRKLVLVLDGQCRHRFGNGPLQLLGKGDVLVVTQPVTQYYELPLHQNVARVHAVVLIFDDRSFDGSVADAAHPEAIPFIEKYFCENAILRGAMDASLFDMAAQIREEAELQLPGFRWRINALCAAGMVRLARCMQEDRPDKNSEVAAAPRGVFLVSSAKEYLLRHLDQDVTLSDVANALHVSNGHLAHTFKRVAGQSLFTYFRHLRLEQAKLKLLNSQNNVTEIAAQCGFSSTALFCRNFKTYTGFTPLTYRDAFGARAEI